MKIPMLDLRAEYLYMKSDIDAAIARCLGHQQWILGPEVKEFEDRVAEYLDVKHCIGTSSGTDALVLALRALAIKLKGQEYWDRSDLIITTPFTFTATGDAILRAGATPLFVDIDPHTYNIDPALIREAIVRSKESGVKSFEAVTPHSLPFTPNCHDSSPLTPHPSLFSVVGILPVHLYGQSCQMDEIMSIAQKNNLFVVEDCAQAFGAKCQITNGNSQKVGSVGTVGCFSFFPSKNLGGFGDAGMVSTNDDEIAELVRMLIKHGGKDKYNVEHIGYNARLDTLQAAILLAKLKYIDEFNSRRQHIAQFYTEELSCIDGIILPLAYGLSPIANDSSPCALSPLPLATHSHVFHQYSIYIKSGKRNELQNFLGEKGVDTIIYYPTPIHKMKTFSCRSKVLNKLSNSEKTANSILSLPIEPLFKQDKITFVIKTIKEFLRKNIDNS